MSQVELKLDYYSGNPIVSLDDGSNPGLPHFEQGDSMKMRVWLVERTGDGGFTYLSNVGITLFAAIGTLLTDPPVYLTNQGTWTANPDIADPYFEAILPLNTSAINTALTAAAVNGKKFITVDFGITFTNSDGQRSAILKTINVYKALIVPGALEVPAGQTPLSLEVANALFLTHDVLGPVTLRNATGQSTSLYVDTDGAFHADKIPV